MTILESIILGIVEGITEFLPVSSTGHLILTSVLLGLPESEFLKTFEIVIQSGAIAAVVALYWRRFFDWKILTRLLVAFLPTGFFGLLLYPLVKTYLLGSQRVVLLALAFGGIALIIFEWLYREHAHQDGHVRSIPYQQAFFVGLFQTLAFIPGVSRSAATIVGGLLMGVRRSVIIEFSFLLAVPTMLAATALDLSHSAPALFTQNWLVLAIGFAVSFLVALIAIRMFLRFAERRTLTAFGIYRIALALLFWFLIL